MSYGYNDGCRDEGGYDFEIDPDTNLDYAFDWNNQLADEESISTSTYTLNDGLVAGVNIIGTRKTAIFLSGAKLGDVYRVTNHITTSAGRSFDQTMRLKAREL